MRLVLDCGSGNTCQNKFRIAGRMINEVAKVDTHEREVVFKWQLFESAPPNIPLDLEVFYAAYDHAKELGYQTTASVFDMASLKALLVLDVPFVKIACRPNLYWLAGEVPRRIPVWMSWDCRKREYPKTEWEPDRWLACIPKYPADALLFGTLKWVAVSDHTMGLGFYRYMEGHRPEFPIEVWEKHYKLSDSEGPDAGPFAVTAEDLKEIM